MKLGRYMVGFEHRRKPLASKLVKDSNMAPQSTICRVCLNDKQLGVGVAACHDNDMFDKDKGRKLALARALVNAGVGLAERKQVWDDYRDSKKGGRW